MAAFLVRQSRIARFLRHTIPPRHGTDRAYLVVHLVPHCRLFPFRWHRAKEENTPRPEFQQKGRKDTAKQSRPERQQHIRGEKGREGNTFNYAVWDKAADAVRQIYPTYKSVKLGTEGIEVAPNPNTDRRQTDKIQFDPQTGRLGSITYYKDAPASQTLKGWFYAFHTGSWGGLWTKVLYFLAAFIGGILPLSGYYLWYKRKFSSRRKR